MLHVSLNFIRLLRVVITPSVRGENDSKQSDEFQASYMSVMSRPRTTDIHVVVNFLTRVIFIFPLFQLR